MVEAILFVVYLRRFLGRNKFLFCTHFYIFIFSSWTEAWERDRSGKKTLQKAAYLNPLFMSRC